MEHVREFVQEVAVLREKNSQLKASLQLPQKQHPPRFQRLLFVPLTLVDGEMKKDPERSRSVVIQGIPESKAPVPSVRVVDDFNPIRDISDIVDFLCIICSTISVFHMGCFHPSRPRLSKGLYRRVFC